MRENKNILKINKAMHDKLHDEKGQKLKLTEHKGKCI